MPSHAVVAGDTYADISIRWYGVATGVAQIKAANPGASDPPIPGTTINVPAAAPLTTPPLPAAPGVDPSEVEIRISGSAFRFWTRVDITCAIDAADTIELVAPPADTAEFRALIQPLSFAPLSVLVGGEAMFTGTMVGVAPAQGPDGARVQVSGYSLPGVLGDCTAPSSAFPLQLKGLDLPQIAQKLCAPFGLVVETEGDVSGKLERVRLQPDRKILGFLADLAKQHGTLISSSAAGALLLLDPPAAGAPVVTLREGDRPLLSVELETNPQAYFSHLTAFRSVSRGVRGAQHTVKNPAAAPGVLRPLITTIQDTSAGELPSAAEALAGRMLAGAVTVNAEVATWRNPAGALWERGATVRIEAPGAMIYRATDMLIRQVQFSSDERQNTAKLSLVLPGSFSGDLPAVLPWQ